MRLRRGRCEARRSPRWFAALLPLALLLAVLGRGHALQAIGLVIDCVHPDDVTAHDAHAEPADEGVASHDHCPSNCTRCPCGQMPTVMPPDALTPMAVLAWHEIVSAARADTPGRVHAHRLDRPPRTTRARTA